MNISFLDSGEGWTIRDQEGHRHLYIEHGGWSTAVSQAAQAHSIDSLAISVAGNESLEFLEGLAVTRLAVLVERAEQLAPLCGLRELQELTVAVRSSSAAAALDFSRLDDLTTLCIDWHPSLEQLIGTASLQSLRINGTPGPDLRGLAALPRLRVLKLGPGRKLVGLAGVERFPCLETLGVYHQPKLADLSAVAELASLGELGLEACRAVTQVGVVAALGQLKNLSLNNCGDIKSLAPLRPLAALEEFFAIESTRILDNDLSPLMELPSLRRFGMKSRRTYSPSVDDVRGHLVATGRWID